MPIQYAEIFINLKRKTYSNYFKSLIGNDISFSEDDTIILSFDNGDVSDTREAERKEICGSQLSWKWSHFPKYLQLDSKMLMMGPIMIYDNDMVKMNFSSIFKNNPKCSTNNRDSSIYNVIYCLQGVDVFAILKMKSSNTRFYLAYDDVLFTREDIMNLVDYILLLKTERKNYDGEYTLLTL